MRVVHSTKPLPRNWSRIAQAAIMEDEIRVSRTSRLRMKLLVFKSKADMRRFWKQRLGNDLGPNCVGVVNGFASEIIDCRKFGSELRRMEVDPRYFAVMALLKHSLSMEVICHESVHGAYNYAKRVTKRDLWCNVFDLDEETICYLAGRIASAVNRALDKAGLYPWSKI